MRNEEDKASHVIANEEKFNHMMTVSREIAITKLELKTKTRGGAYELQLAVNRQQYRNQFRDITITSDIKDTGDDHDAQKRTQVGVIRPANLLTVLNCSACV